LVITCLLLIDYKGFAQQSFQASQYMFNPHLFNPAYAGSRDRLSVSFNLRSQWSGFNGAPKTNVFGVHSPLKNQKVSLGLQMISDKLGPSRSFGLLGTYAYRMQYGNGRLSFGLSGGFYNYVYDFNAIDLPNPEEISQFNSQHLLPTANAGMYYYTKNSYLGLSAINLLGGNTLSKDFNGSFNSKLSRHYYLMAGKAFTINDDLVFNPSAQVKFVTNAPLNVDLNFNVIVKSKFWVGITTRLGYGVILITQYDVGDGLRLGYAADLTLNNLGAHTGLSHEIMISKDLNLFKLKVNSPRYF